MASSKTLEPSPLAKASKITGLLSLFLGWIPLIGWGMILFSVVGGLMAISDISQKRYAESSARDARFGIISGGIALVLIPLELIAFGLILLALES